MYNQLLLNCMLCDLAMEDLSFSFPVLFISFIFLFLLIQKLGKRSKPSNPTHNLPPGPWTLPLIGSLHHLFGPSPHKRLRDLAQKHGPLMHLKLGEVSTIVVSSPEVAKEILKTHDTIFAQRPRFPYAEVFTYGCTDIVFSPYGDYWKETRKICTLELLSAKRVKYFQSTREEEVKKLVRYVSANAGSCINLSEKIFTMTYAITGRMAFGDKCKDLETFVSIFKESKKLVEGFSISDLFPSQKWLFVVSGMKKKLEEIHGRSDMLFESIIGETVRKNGQVGADGLLSVLLNMKDRGDLEISLTMNNIKAIILDMFTAGSETSATTVDWAISELLKNPRVMKKAQEEVRQVFGSKGYVDETGLQELEFLKAVIKETLRVHPPGPLIPRECRETCVINGYTILESTRVFVNAWAIGRDPKYWTGAEKFYPERFLNCPIDYKGSNFEFIPFGAGKRICPGMLFGVANVELPLAQLLYYFDWELPSGTTHENLDMAEAMGTVRRKTDLWLIPVSNMNLVTI